MNTEMKKNKMYILSKPKKVSATLVYISDYFFQVKFTEEFISDDVKEV